MQDIECVIVDWGGVLTRSINDSVASWMQQDGINEQIFESVISQWLGPAAGLEAHFNPIHALERGAIQVPDFEKRLAQELTLKSHHEFDHNGLLQRMFDHFEQAHDMRGLVYRVKKLGYKTALLSNSWGNEYPREGWDEMFDVIVISGEVGMRKPERRIFQYTLDKLEIPGSNSVFVDDVKMNIDAGVEVGLIGIHHETYEKTRSELEILLGTNLE